MDANNNVRVRSESESDDLSLRQEDLMSSSFIQINVSHAEPVEKVPPCVMQVEELHSKPLEFVPVSKDELLLKEPDEILPVRRKTQNTRFLPQLENHKWKQ